MRFSIHYLLVVAALTSIAACSRTEGTAAAVSPDEAIATPRSLATAPDEAENVDAVVENVLHTQYPEGFDSSHRCWRVTRKSADGDTHYCMRPLTPQVVKSPAGNRIYIATSSADDIRGDANYLYQSTTPGLFGVFEVQTGAASSRIVAAANALEYGTSGSCGCEGANFQQIGHDKYAWIFASGGTWQGVTVANYAIVVPQDGHAIDVGNIPQITEDAQNIAYGFKVDRSDPSLIWYPLSITKRISGKPVDQRSVQFDEKSHVYRKPQDF